MTSSRSGRRKEYTLTVRQLASYVNKRDPRVKAFKEAKAAAKEASAKLHAERVLQQKVRARAQLQEALDDAVLAEVDAVYDEIDRREAELDERYGTNNGDSSDEEEEGQYCVACKKAFKNVKQWHNHEKSKKHKEKVAKIRKELQREDAASGGGRAAPAATAAGVVDDADGVPLEDGRDVGRDEDDGDEDDGDAILFGEDCDNEEEWLRQEEAKDRALLEQGIADSLTELVAAAAGGTEESEGEADVGEAAAAAATTKEAGGAELVGADDADAAAVTDAVDVVAHESGGGGGGSGGGGDGGGDGGSVSDSDGGSGNAAAAEGGGNAAEKESGNSDDNPEETAPVPAATQTKNRKKLRKQMKLLKAQLAASTNDTTEWAKFNDDTSEKTCQVCKATFSSRSKLFAHIEETGHAIAQVAGGGGGGGQAAGKLKSKKARKKEGAGSEAAAAADPKPTAGSDDGGGVWEDETKGGKKKKKKKKK